MIQLLCEETANSNHWPNLCVPEILIVDSDPVSVR